MLLRVLLLGGLAACSARRGAELPGAVSCSSELDCELSGVCVRGSCVCDPGWSGPHCTTLELLPNPPGHFAYHARDPDDSSALWNSWGSSQPVKAGRPDPRSPLATDPLTRALTPHHSRASAPSHPHRRALCSQSSDGRYHLLATRVLNGCQFPEYTYNMDLVHAVSDTLLGPFAFGNVALGPSSAAPFRRWGIPSSLLCSGLCLLCSGLCLLRVEPAH